MNNDEFVVDDEFVIRCTPDVAPKWIGEAKSFKAYAITDYDEWMRIEELYRIPPQVMNNDLEGFMKELFEIAQENTEYYYINYDCQDQATLRRR